MSDMKGISLNRAFSQDKNVNTGGKKQVKFSLCRQCAHLYFGQHPENRGTTCLREGMLRPRLLEHCC